MVNAIDLVLQHGLDGRGKTESGVRRDVVWDGGSHCVAGG
jgi:hypothetical protein